MTFHILGVLFINIILDWQHFSYNSYGESILSTETHYNLYDLNDF